MKPFLERHSPKLRALRLLVVRLLHIHLHLKCPVCLDGHDRSLFSGLRTYQPVPVSSPPQITRTLVAMIGKTRQPSFAQIEEVFDPEVGRARGILRRPLSSGKLSHARRSPPPDLAYWIAHYWMITWDLRGCAPHLAEALPHPNIHVVFEKDNAVVSGIQTRKFSRLLEGRSQVFGVKFHPGGFRPFLKSSVSALADSTVPANRIFGKAVNALTRILASARKESEKVAAANAFFGARLPEPDDTIALAGQ